MYEFKPTGFKLKASNIKSASLSARLRLYSETPHHYNLTVSNGTGTNQGTVTLTYAGAIAGGVYRLKLISNDGCCCYSDLVYTPGCPAVVMGNGPDGGSNYSGTGGVPEVIPSCEP